LLICAVAFPAAAGTPGPLASGAFRQQGSAQTEQAAPEKKPPKKKRVFLAFIMSVFIPTSGQFYNGQYSKGALGLAVMASGLVIYAMGNDENDKAELGDPGLVLVAGTWLWSMIDAPISAQKINEEIEGQKSVPMGYAPPPGWDVYTSLSPSKRSARAGVLLRF
jgi:hypothetical protein